MSFSSEMRDRWSNVKEFWVLTKPDLDLNLICKGCIPSTKNSNIEFSLLFCCFVLSTFWWPCQDTMSKWSLEVCYSHGFASPLDLFIPRIIHIVLPHDRSWLCNLGFAVWNFAKDLLWSKFGICIIFGYLLVNLGFHLLQLLQRICSGVMT